MGIRSSLIFLLPLASCLAASGSTKRPADAPLNASQIADATQPVMGVNAKGSGVVRAQILLDRAHFSCGEIDGVYGSNMQKAVAAFGRSHNLPATGEIGPEIWAALNADQSPLLIGYTITKDDLTGPFNKVPADMMEQAKLPHLGYESPLDELGERFHASQEVLKGLNPDSTFDKEGETIQAPNVTTNPPGTATSVLVSKSDSSVAALDDQGRIVAYYVATIGSEHDPLPVGDEKVKVILHNPVFHYDPQLFWNADPKDEKAVIKSGPRNPVGVVWIGLSKEHYGIHGTPVPGKIGHAESHGCIRLTNWDALELSQMIKPGTPVNLTE